MSSIGVASVSIVPLRAEASDSSEQTSQILAGEGVSLLEKGRGDWMKIKSLEDGYVGWCDKKQFTFDVKLPEERTILCHPISQWKNESDFMVHSRSIDRRERGRLLFRFR